MLIVRCIKEFIVSYRIEMNGTCLESFDGFEFNIYKDDTLIAKYWHDERGDDQEIEFINGVKESHPIGRMIDFINAGDLEPMSLSEKAVEYLNKNTS